MSSKGVKSQQKFLKDQGLYHGALDGEWGNMSVDAMKGWAYRHDSGNMDGSPFKRPPEGYKMVGDELRAVKVKPAADSSGTHEVIKSAKDGEFLSEAQAVKEDPNTYYRTQVPNIAPKVAKKVVKKPAAKKKPAKKVVKAVVAKTTKKPAAKAASSTSSKRTFKVTGRDGDKITSK